MKCMTKKRIIYKFNKFINFKGPSRNFKEKSKIYSSQSVMIEAFTVATELVLRAHEDVSPIHGSQWGNKHISRSH